MRVALLLLVATSVAFAQPDARDSRSDTVAVRAKDGDSYGLIAAEFYGDRKHGNLLLLENNIKPPKPLRPGMRVRVPIAREIVTAPKDTWATIAEAQLGSARRAAFLAELNGMKDDESPAAGTVVTIPFTVAYTATAATESLATISTTYLGSAKHAQRLSSFNLLDGALEIEKGQTIRIPAFHIKMLSSKLKPLDDKAKERRELQATNMQRAADALPRARHAWRIGDFETIRTRLGALDTDYLPEAQAVEAGVLLGSAHVAFGDDAAAKTAFETVLDRKPSHELDTFSHSPKVIAVWKQAVGAAE